MLTIIRQKIRYVQLAKCWIKQYFFNSNKIKNLTNVNVACLFEKIKI